MYGLLTLRLVYRKVESTFFISSIRIQGKEFVIPGTGGISKFASTFT